MKIMIKTTQFFEILLNEDLNERWLFFNNDMTDIDIT